MRYEPDDSQEEVLKFIEDKGNRVILVTAPPGTGKTYTGIKCAQRIIELRQIRPHQKVLFLTFCKNARAQLDTELSKVEDSTIRRQIEVSNFHSFFKEKIWPYRTFLGLPLRVNVVSERARYNAIQNLLGSSALGQLKRQTGVSNKWEILGHLSRGLELNHPEFRYREIPGNTLLKVVSHIRQENKGGRIYFDDLGYLFYRLINESPWLRQVYRTKYPVIIVDEFQDSTRVQWQIIKMLTKTGRLIIFADEYQQLYEWLGASNEWIADVDSWTKTKRKELREFHRYKDKPELQIFFQGLRKVLFNNEPPIYTHGRFVTYSGRNHFNFKNYIKSLILNKIRQLEKANEYSIGVLFIQNEDVHDLRRYLLSKGKWSHEISRNVEDHNFFHDFFEQIPTIRSHGDYAQCLLTSLREISSHQHHSGREVNWALISRVLTGEQNARPRGNKREAGILKSLETKANGFDGDPTQILGDLCCLTSELEGIFVWDERILNTIERMRKNLVKTTSSEELTLMEKIDSCIGIFLQQLFIRTSYVSPGVYVLNVNQAKGKEFDYVILPCLSKISFWRDDLDLRKKLYVALTRAKKDFVAYYPPHREMQPEILFKYFKVH